MFDKVKSEMKDPIIITDTSSSIGSRDFATENLWDDLGIVYCGAQKNLGASGVTYVIIREDILDKVKSYQ